jgi:hypothetical protein
MAGPTWSLMFEALRKTIYRVVLVLSIPRRRDQNFDALDLNHRFKAIEHETKKKLSPAFFGRAPLAGHSARQLKHHNAAARAHAPARVCTSTH